MTRSTTGTEGAAPRGRAGARAALALALAAGCLAASGCEDRKGGRRGGDAGTAVSGVAVDGRVLGGAGKVLALASDGTESEIGDVTTDPVTGALSFAIAAVGPARIRLDSGTYVDGASGLATQLTASSPLEAIFVASAGAQTVHVTPLTSVASRLLDARRAADPTLAVDAGTIAAMNAAAATAFGVVDANGDPVDPTSIQPLDLSFAADAQAFAADPGSPEARYGMLLGGLAQVAAGGGFADVPALVEALASDAADGALDALDADGQAIAGLGVGSATTDLAAGIAAFLIEPHVAATFTGAALTPPDPAAIPEVQDLQDDVATSNGAVPLPPVAGAPTPGAIALGGLANGFINAATDEAAITATVTLPLAATPAIVGDVLDLAVTDAAGTSIPTARTLDAGDLAAGSVTFTDPGTGALVEGALLFTARIRRTVASATTTSLASSATAVKDETSATSTLTAPAAGTLVGAAGTQLVAQVDGTGSGIASVVFRVGGQTIATVTTAPFAAAFVPAATSLADGVHDVIATATDRAGNAPGASAAVSITLDTTAPTGTFDPDPAGLVVSGAAQAVSAAVQDATGLASATFTLTDGGGATVAATVTLGGVGTTAATPQATLDTTGLADGAATLTLSVTDAAGNVAAAADTAQVIVINDAPVFTSAAPLAATEGVLYTYTVATTGQQVALIATTLPASGWLSFDANTGTLSGTPQTGDIGPNDVELTATNPAGLATQSFTIQVAPAGLATGVWDQSTWDNALWGQ